MKNNIDKNQIYILERELTKATTDFYISEFLFEKSYLDLLKRYSQFLKDISNHYAYTSIECLYKIFDKGTQTNNIDYVIRQLIDKAKQNNYNQKIKQLRGNLKPILDRRSENISHSEKKTDNDYLVFYKTYSIQEYNDIIKPALNDIADLLYNLREDFGYASDLDHIYSGTTHECGYLINSLIEIEKQRGYVN